MSWWDRVKDAVATAGHVVTNSPAVVIDLASSPFADDDEWQAARKAFAVVGGAAGAVGSEVGTRLGYAMQGLETAYHEGVGQPLATGVLQEGTFWRNLASGHPGAGLRQLFDPSQWSQAYHTAEHVSPGQALVSATSTVAAAALPGNQGFEHMDPTTPEGVKAIVDKTPGGSFSSGAADFAARFYLDPAVLGGKTLKVARVVMSERPIRAGMDLDKVVNATPTQRLLEATFKRDTPEKRLDFLLRNPTIQGQGLRSHGADPAIAELVARADDIEEARLVLKAAITKDPLAEKALMDRNAAIYDAMMELKTERMPLLERTLAGKGDVLVLPDAAKRSVDDQFRAFKDHYQMLAEELAANELALRAAGTVERVPRLTLGEKITERGLDKSPRGTGVSWTMWQPSRYNLPGRIIKAASTTRPGTLDYSRPDSWRNMQRYLDQAGVDEQTRGGILSRYIQAGTEQEKGLAADQAEAAAMVSESIRLGLPPDVAQVAIDAGRHRRSDLGGLFAHASPITDNKVYSGALRQDGQPLDLMDIDGAAIRVPVSVTQLENYRPLLDVQTMVKDLSRYKTELAGHGDDLRAAVARLATGQRLDQSKATLEEAAEIVLRVWKPLVLMRLGFPMRMVSDESMRAISTLDAFSYVPIAVASAGRGITRGAQRTLGKLTRTAPEDVKQAGQIAEGRIDIGPYNMADAFHAMQTGPNWKALGSSAETIERWSTEQGRAHASMRARWAIPAEIRPQQKQWDSAWRQAVNDQLLNDPIVQRILKGQTDEEIAAWVRTQHDLRARLPLRSHNPDMWVGELRQQTEHYLPTEELRALAAKNGKVTLAQMKKAFPNKLDRPVVHGESLALATGSSRLWGAWEGLTNRFYANFAQAPSDVLVRHPFYALSYRNRLRQLVKDYDPGLEGTIPPEVQAGLLRRSHEHALAQVRNRMYDHASETNLAASMRFLSGFYGAWEDAIRHWADLMVEDPARLARGVLAYQGMTDLSYNRDGVDYIPMPDFMVKGLNLLPWVNLPAGDIPKDSLNTIIQGEIPWLPSAGPLVQVALGELVRRRPETAEGRFKAAIDWALPFGADKDAINQMAPAWAKRLRSKESEDRAFGRSLVAITAELEYERKVGKNTYTDAELHAEAHRRADELSNARVAASLSLPFSVVPRSRYQPFIDAYADYQERFGEQADEKFLQNYGEEFFSFTADSSRSVDAVSPTVNGLEAEQRYGKWLKATDDRGVKSFIVGGEDIGPFSGAVLEAQYRAGNRETIDPVTAIEDTQRRAGWIAYRKASDIVDGELQRRGLRDINQKGAEDLAQYKRDLRNTLADKYPAWWRDWAEADSGRTADYARQFTDLLNDPDLWGKVQHRPGMETMRSWLKTRQVIATELRRRGQAGGSQNLQAGTQPGEGNYDLRDYWNSLTGYFAQHDVAFADMHRRFFENDTLEMGR